MKSLSVDDNLPLLAAQAVAGVIQVRCPVGLSIMSADDAYLLMSNIKGQLVAMDYNFPQLFKERLDELLSTMSDEELSIEFDPWTREDDWSPSDYHTKGDII